MKRFSIYLSVLFQVLVFSALPALATDTTTTAPSKEILGGLISAGQDSGYQAAAIPIPQLVGNIVQVVLGLTGIIFLIITVYAGVLYMTAAGDATKAEKGKKMIMQSVIGLIIVVSAYAISTFVITQLSGAV